MGTKLDQDKIKDDLEFTLPHGSGIDSDWIFDFTKDGKKAIASNSYHCMDQNGYYDGFADFSITISFDKPRDFILRFHGKQSQYKNQKYGLRDYLEDTLYLSLEKFKLTEN